MTEFTTYRQNSRTGLHTVQTDKFKMSRLSFNFIIPKDKLLSQLTKLTLSVMMRGSEKYPSITEINKSLDDLYGTNVSFRALSVGDKSVFRISCKMLDNRYRMDGDDTDILEEVIKILSDIVFNPLRDENGLLLADYVESEKKIAVDSIRSQINDQRAYASRQCDAIMFKDTPYGISTGGDIKTISELTQEQVTSNAKYFVDNAHLECYYVGSEDPSRVRELISKYFDLTGEGELELKYEETPFLSNRENVVYVENVMPVSQGRLSMGYRCGVVLADDKYYAMSLCNEILGGSSVAKLFLNVREKKSLCYYCYSTYHSATGTIKIGCGINPENRDIAQEEIEKQILLMKNGEFDDGEIEVAKRTIISGLKQISDSPASMEAYAFRRAVASAHDSIDECIKKINAVRREDIIEVAQALCLDTVYFLNGSGEGETDDE